MRKNLKFFTSRLARRFFLMFVASALIPIIILAAVAYKRVSRQITEQASDRLRQSVKSHALDIYERLVIADHRLQLIQAMLNNFESMESSRLPGSVTERNREIFTGFLRIYNDKVVYSWGEGVSNTFQELPRKLDLEKDTTALMSLDDGKKWPTVMLIRCVGGHGKRKDYLIGAINPSFLWGLQSGTGLGPASEFAVWDDQGRSLFSSLGFPVAMDQNISRNQDEKNSGQTELTIQNNLYHAFFWAPFMKPRFHVPHWTVMVMEPRDYMLKPLKSFQMLFLGIIALSFLIVVFLTNRAIRSSLIPIDALMDGARQVAKGLFSHRVVVKSKDEFQDVADAFNHMSDELNIQFKALSARSDLDNTILSVLDIDQIIFTSLDHSNSFIPHSTASISIVEEVNLPGQSYIREHSHQVSPYRVESFQLSLEERELFSKNRNWLRNDANKIALRYLEALKRPDVDHFIVFPAWVQNRLYALVTLGINSGIHYGERELEHMRGFVDHLSIAFDNSNLLKELKELNLGTLYALARTVDAKSPWTAGHSVRVTQTAIEIGKVLGLPQESLDDLQRAALLHDIGKIGVPQVILDKPDKLTDTEYEIIKKHPSIGARILGPIQAYKKIIPMIEEHHERYDGKGYPFGKCGEEIHLYARIMALADAFDAMVSDRPYREGLGRDRAIKIIREEAGSQFDPKIVEAFNQVVDRPIGIIPFESFEMSSQPIIFLDNLFGSDAAGEVQKIGSMRSEGKPR